MRRNWQPINLSNFAADFAIFQPNLHLTAHSYLSAAGRLHMLNVAWIKEGKLSERLLFNWILMEWFMFK